MGDRYCSVVDSINCERPPGYPGSNSSMIECYSCGDDTCKSCSSVILYAAGNHCPRMVRMCFNCQDMRKVGRAA